MNEKGTVFEVLTGFHENCLAFIYEGSVVLNGTNYEKDTALVFATPLSGRLEYITLTANTTTAQFILLCGEPTKEIVYNQGPFVLDSKENLYKAFDDYKKGKNGFEGADTWKSQMPELPRSPKQNKKRSDL